eukprot:4032421-Pyramimonas_sp.AAC.1
MSHGGCDHDVCHIFRHRAHFDRNEVGDTKLLAIAIAWLRARVQSLCPQPPAAWDRPAPNACSS